MAEPMPMQVHRHFKGADKKYLVLGVATHTEGDHPELVIYVPLYGENAGKLLARPKSMWVEDVKRDGYEGPRFWPLEQNPPDLG